MVRRLLLSLLTVIAVTTVTGAADLFKVSVDSQADADALIAIGVDPLVRLHDGYLVLAEGDAATLLATPKFNAQHMASNVAPQDLALDNRLDESNVSKYPVLYQQGDLRLYKANIAELPPTSAKVGLIPLSSHAVRIEYTPPRATRWPALVASVDLDSLVSLVSQDSLESYTSRLQAYFRRPSGSDSNYAAADWTKAKFQEFGYDSVYSDQFTTSIWGVPTLVENTVAVKLGSRFPDRYIIVGGHRDGVDDSPAADDNGSGSAATLELARVLKDIDTYCTFLFITFDAEEDGLIGSEHFAEEASGNGDTIIYMLNFDMIAHYENSTQAKLYHGSDPTYSELWQSVAEPLVGLTGVLTGTTSGSDHYPFQQEGYDVTFVHEYEFSSVYHGPHDSTSYMNFTYMTKVVKASLATAYLVMLDATAPLLEFTYPDGLPEYVIAGDETDFLVQLVPRNGGVAVPGSASLHCSIDGAPFVATQLVYLSDNTYQATLPAVTCDNTLEYYFSVDEQESGTQNDPNLGDPYSVVVATEVLVPFADDFEVDRGWTFSGGTWGRGAPTGGGGEHGSPDPVGGYNSANCLGYNLAGDYENSIPERHATSPAIDCSALSGTHLKFQRWLGVEQPLYDHAYIRVSTNGTGWTDVWENDATITDDSWQSLDYDISSLVDGQSAVYLRFTMGLTDGYWRFCGWNIDDLELSAYVCQADPDADGDGVLNSVDNCPTTYNPLQEDGDLDGIGDSCDVCTDSDDDGFGNPGYPANTCAEDNCPVLANPDQLDPDGDGIGSACDNCADDFNPEQEDTDGDNIGDVCDYICGDAEADQVVNIADAVYLISYIFGGGSAPQPMAAGDVDCDSVVNIADAVHIISYIFGGGPAPCAACP